MRVGLQDPFAAVAACDQPHDRAHRDAQPADAGLAAHHGGIVADPNKSHQSIVGSGAGSPPQMSAPYCVVLLVPHREVTVMQDAHGHRQVVSFRPHSGGAPTKAIALPWQRGGGQAFRQWCAAVADRRSLADAGGRPGGLRAGICAQP